MYAIIKTPIQHYIVVLHNINASNESLEFAKKSSTASLILEFV